MEEEDAIVHRPPSPTRRHETSIKWWAMLIRPCLAEYIGTTLFVFAGILSTFHSENEKGAVVSVALGHGMALFVMVATTATVSGGHLNPAVTLGIFLTGTLAPVVALGFVGAQLLGGITGAGLAKGLLNSTVTKSESGFALTEPPSYQDDVQAIFAEVVLTAILVLTVLMVAVETKGNNPIAPFAIGMAVTAGIFAGGNVSGASMNPARSFGPAVVFNTWQRVWVYFVGCPVGGIIASIAYRLVLTDRSLPIPIVSFFKRHKVGSC